jgi:RNA polymerase sigma-70 factor (ECF subfamily)
MSIVSKLFKVSYVSHTDEELMELFKDGDMKAFEVIYSRYKDKVLSYSFYQLKRKALAEELTQDIFIHLDRKKDYFDGTKKFSPWFWQIAKNLIIDNQRKKDPTFGVNFKFNNEEILDEVELLESEDFGPEMNSIEKADQKVIQDCIDKLKTDQKDAFLLRIFSELSYEDISKELDKSVAGIKSLINRARTSVIKCVQGALCEI